MARHRLADAKVGSQYAARDFATQVTPVGAMVMAQMDARDFADDLPGLGIPSDFAALADPVSIGASMKKPTRRPFSHVLGHCIGPDWWGLFPHA